MGVKEIRQCATLNWLMSTLAVPDVCDAVLSAGKRFSWRGSMSVESSSLLPSKTWLADTWVSVAAVKRARLKLLLGGLEKCFRGQRPKIASLLMPICSPSVDSGQQGGAAIKSRLGGPSGCLCVSRTALGLLKLKVLHSRRHRSESRCAKAAVIERCSPPSTPASPGPQK